MAIVTIVTTHNITVRWTIFIFVIILNNNIDHDDNYRQIIHTFYLSIAPVIKHSSILISIEPVISPSSKNQTLTTHNNNDYFTEDIRGIKLTHIIMV